MKKHITSGRFSLHSMPFFSHQVNPHVPVPFKKVNGVQNRYNGKHNDAFSNGQKLQPPKVKDLDSGKNGKIESGEEIQAHKDAPQIQSGYLGIEDVYTASSLLSMEIPENFWLVDQLILSESINFVAGDSDCGKSSLLSQLGKDICNRSPEFIGFKLNAKYNSAIYVSTEDHPTGQAIKLQKQYYRSDGDVTEMMNYAFLFHTDNLLARLDFMLQKQSADLIIIDAFADIVRGDLNNSTVVRAFLESFRNLALKYKCAVVLVHHTTKISSKRNPNKIDLVGSQAITAFARQVLMLTKTGSDPTRRELHIVKGNYLSEDFKQNAIPLVFDGETLTFSLSKKDVEDGRQHKPINTKEIDADKSNFATRRKRRGRKQKLTQTDLSAIKQMRKAGMILQQIGDEYNVDKGTVSRFLKKHGVVK